MRSEEIKAVRKELGYTQKEFGEKLGVSLRAVQSWESGDRNISQSAALVLNELLLKNKNAIHNESEEEFWENKSGNKYFELPNGKYIVKVPLVPAKAYATYISEHCDADFIDGLIEISFDVDHIGRGKYVAFEIKGDSMDNGGLYDNPNGATTLCRELGRQHWKDGFRDSKYGWIIIHKDSILCKDIIYQDLNTGIITCHSRNTSPEYSDFEISLDDVLQIFKIIKRTF